MILLINVKLMELYSHKIIVQICIDKQAQTVSAGLYSAVAVIQFAQTTPFNLFLHYNTFIHWQ